MEESSSPETKKNDEEEKTGTLVLFVRHGTTPTTGSVLPGRAPGLHLADTGINQAKTAATRIAALEKVAAVYASPLERTQETAAPIATACGVTVTTHEGLIECDFGDWTGRELKELMKLPEWKTVQRYPSGFRFPNGESFAEMQQRIVATTNELAASHRGNAAVFVSHADPIKAAVAHYCGTPLDLFQRYVVSPCSISAFSVGTNGVIALSINSTGNDLKALVPS